MAPVTFSSAEVDAFRTAMLLNPGVLEMRLGDRSYKFATLKEMQERLAFMQRNVAASATTASGAVRYAQTSKGF